jgi:hypothetical protein
LLSYKAQGVNPSENPECRHLPPSAGGLTKLATSANFAAIRQFSQIF